MVVHVMKHLPMRILKSTGLVQFLNNACVPILLMSSGKGMNLSVLSLAMVKNSRILTIRSKLGWQPILEKDNSECWRKQQDILQLSLSR